MEEEIEEWKDIPNYEGYYQCSNMGRIKGLSRVCFQKEGKNRRVPEKILKPINNPTRYYSVDLHRKSVHRVHRIHQVVALVFLGHSPNNKMFVVDHINGIRIDNRLSNLRIVSRRQNVSTCFRSDKSSMSSRYIGVSWYKAKCKWISCIWIKGRLKHLGYFDSELNASNAYQNELLKLN